MQRQPVDTPVRLARVLWFSLLVVVLGGLLERGAAAQAVSFAPHIDYGAGTLPKSVALGDFNRDGNLDFAVANGRSNTVSIFLGTGMGSFGAKTDFGTGAGPGSVAVGDFNRDGKLDLVTANGGDDSVSILLGNGDGSFGAKTDFGTGSNPVSVSVGDLNRDGILDLAVANELSSTISILLGTGTGVFGTKTDFGTGDFPLSVAVGDFNGDGDPDLAAPSYNNGIVSILLGTGTGTFGAKTNFATGAGSASVALGDFNGDGKLDLATANIGGNTVSILLGTGTGSFGAKTDFATGPGPNSVAVGDFNGDGKLDLAVTNGGSASVSILLGTGTGSFGPKTDFGVGFVPGEAAVGDFNRDGKPDLAVANTNPNLNTVSILLNTTSISSSGIFCRKTDFLTGSVPFSVATGDFNGDGKLDLAVANSNSDTVSILLGTGAGGFGAKTDFGTGAGPFSVVVGDFNGDGKLDLATANANSDSVSVLLGAGTGSFGSKTDFGAGGAPRSIAVGDFNRDGHLDLAIANANSSTISILLGTGTGGFGAKTDFGTGAAPRSVAVADFNRDGILDLAVANSNSNTVSILLGTGSGTFSTRADFSTGSAPFSVAAGDFNNDGQLDLAAANANSNTVSILLGTGTGSFGARADFGTGSAPFSVVAGDFNRDGKLDLAVANLNSDSVSILGGTGTGSFGARSDFGTATSPRSVAAGDFNADGKLDLAVANEISSSVSVLVNTCSNNPPDITAAHLTVFAGAPSANYQIAVVSDAEDAESSLIVTVNAGASASVNGVNVSGISVFPSGSVGANVVADCNATTATFTLRVTDTGGLFTDATLTVTVNPNTTPPMITCPGETVGHTDLNQCSTIVTFAPTVTGNCSGMLTPICSPASGSRFSKGVTTVTCQVSDSSGNHASCSFQVRVIDSQRPTLTGPGHIVKSTEPFQCSAVVNYPPPTVTDNCPGPFNPTCSPSSGFRFPRGTTLVTCHVVDQSANEQTSVFEVTVVDAQAPVFATPVNIAATAAASCPYATSKVVTYSNPVASDNCAVQSVVCNPPSGATFPLGATTVNCAATDTSGNIGTCSFTVNVYSFGIQDELNAGNVVLVNASTGDYSFCCNGVPVASGRGILNVSGCIGSIDHAKGDRRVHIEWDATANGGAGTGFAYVKQSTNNVCQITDKQLTNDSCQCSTAPPSVIIIGPPPPRG
jgi:hypothetical protein